MMLFVSGQLCNCNSYFQISGTGTIIFCDINFSTDKIRCDLNKANTKKHPCQKIIFVYLYKVGFYIVIITTKDSKSEKLILQNSTLSVGGKSLEWSSDSAPSKPYVIFFHVDKFLSCAEISDKK